MEGSGGKKKKKELKAKHYVTFFHFSNWKKVKHSADTSAALWRIEEMHTILARV